MYILNVLHGGCRLGELCSGDIDITTPRLHAQNTNQLLRCAAGVFFLRRVFKMSDGPVLVRLRRNQSGSQWGFTMQGGYDQGSCLYIQKVRKPCVYYIQFWKYDIRSYRRKRPCLVSSTTCARPQLKPRFKNIFINLLPRLYIIILGPPVATLQCTPLTWQLYLHLYMSVSFRDIDPIESRGSSRGFNR